MKEIRSETVQCFKNEQGQFHGEYKSVYSDGAIGEHCFYVNGKEVSFNEIPYPETEEDRIYFMLKYDLPLLPVRKRRVKRN